MSEEQGQEQEAAEAAKAKRNSIPRDEIDALVAGLPRYEKTSFLVVGHRGGVRIAIPKTSTGVSRAYFYASGDYSLIPSLPAIKVADPDERKAQRKGGIMAEVDFTIGRDEALAALAALVEVVRSAPAPAPKGLKKAKRPKEADQAPAEPAPIEES